jgi:hypothetical protein
VTNHDTYGDAAARNALATALGALGKDQMGILTSYDAWEGFDEPLRGALKKLGLYKAMSQPGRPRMP